MANPYFQFKQFTVWHDKCAMKVGTDGVLLGAWCCVENITRILDVGCGTGLISLMLAQRCQAEIDAVDIDEAACIQARENADRSPFGDRLQIFHRPFANFVNESAGIRQYDCIVSNPPYFIDSLKCPDKQRNQARHTDTLTLEELIEGSKQLLAPQGKLYLILPFDQREILLPIIFVSAQRNGSSAHSYFSPQTIAGRNIRHTGYRSPGRYLDNREGKACLYG